MNVELDNNNSQQQDAGLDAEVAEIFGISSPAPAAPEAPAAAPSAAEPAGEGVVAPPSAPAEPAPAAPSEPTPPAALPPLESTPAAPAQPVAEPPAAPVVDEQALQLRSLQAQLEAAQAQITALSAKPGEATPAEPKPGTGPAAEEPRFDLVVPDQVAAAIFNEDPKIAHHGLNHLISGLATMIYKRASDDFKQQLNGFRTELTQQSTEAQQEAQRTQMREEYYNAFPAHKNPVIEPILAQVSASLAAEFPGAPWDDNYRNALGARVNAAIAGLTGQPPAPAPAGVTPTPAPTPAPKPAAFVPTAPRAGQPAAGSEEAFINEVSDIFAAKD